MGECIVLLVIIAIIAIIAVLSGFMTSYSNSSTMESDYDHDADTSYYKYKNLHVKTKALHKLYPQLKVMPEVTMDSNLLQVVHNAAICSNQLCDILMMRSIDKRKK